MLSDKELKATINSQKQEIYRQRKELTESIRYASYIQKALLPSSDIFNRLIPEHFIYFQPKDIVSGDFYWITKKKSEIIIAVGDSTGHGVPGAFMSILGISILNEIVDRGSYKTAGSILNQMREGIMKSLGQTGEDYEPKDGIDMSLCILNKETEKIQFAGAFNPIYIIKENDLVEIPGDKMQIGIAADEERAFKTHHLKLDPCDVVYLFSDGFVDQFGGSEGKKFKYRPFRNLLMSIHKLPLHEQKEKLHTVFEDWKNGYSQLDDVLILGFRHKC